MVHFVTKDDTAQSNSFQDRTHLKTWPPFSFALVRLCSNQYSSRGTDELKVCKISKEIHLLVCAQVGRRNFFLKISSLQKQNMLRAQKKKKSCFGLMHFNSEFNR